MHIGNNYVTWVVQRQSSNIYTVIKEGYIL